ARTSRGGDGHLLAASLSTCAAIATTSVAAMSRMQRCAFMVQTGRWHGWHGTTVLVCTVAARPFSGAQRWGLVGPKIPMVGVPSAAAICIRPESLDIATLAAAIA